jgi:hypothetical protein
MAITTQNKYLITQLLPRGPFREPLDFHSANGSVKINPIELDAYSSAVMAKEQKNFLYKALELLSSQPSAPTLCIEGKKIDRRKEKLSCRERVEP